jgi:hypothetical protein
MATRTYPSEYAVYAILKVGDCAHCQLVARLVLIALLVRSHELFLLQTQQRRKTDRNGH